MMKMGNFVFYILTFFLIKGLMDGKMTQQRKARATKPKYLNLSTGPAWWEDKTTLTLPSNFTHVLWHATPPPTQMSLNLFK